MNALHSRTRVSARAARGRAVGGALRRLGKATAGEAIDGQYIVVLKYQSTGHGRGEGQDPRARPGARSSASTRRVAQGLLGEARPRRRSRRSRSDPAVAYVEPDRVITLDATQTNATVGPGPHRPAQPAAEHDVHLHADRRGRHRVHHRHRHPHRRTASSAAARSAASTPSTAARADDCNGHGTHVAGTVGGTTYGVAKGVTPRRRARAQLQRLGHHLGRHRGHRLGHRQPRGRRPAVANMSLGGGA